jgi:hypothetical protein
MKTVLLFVGVSALSVLTAQVNTPDSDANPSTPAPQPVPPYQRPASHGGAIPNIIDNQSKIGIFPAKVSQKSNWIPAATIQGTAAALIARDPEFLSPVLLTLADSCRAADALAALADGVAPLNHAARRLRRFLVACGPRTKSPGICALPEPGFLQEIFRVSGQDETKSAVMWEVKFL